MFPVPLKERERKRERDTDSIMLFLRMRVTKRHSFTHSYTKRRMRPLIVRKPNVRSLRTAGAKSSRDLETPIGPVVCRGSNCSQLVPAEFLLFLPVLVCTYTENTEWQACIHDTCDGVESRADYALGSSRVPLLATSRLP